MITTTLILILLLICWKYLKDYINFLKQEIPERLTEAIGCFLMITNLQKKDFKPDSKKVLRKRRFRNSLIMLLYIDVLLIFLFLIAGYPNY